MIELKFDENGLIPAIAQDAETGEILMQAYMNREAYEKTLETKKVHYYSRSRQKLWLKGETSGHFQHLVAIYADCDADCLLVKIRQEGVACHTGARSCFFNKLYEKNAPATGLALYEDAKIIHERKINPKDGSYTNYLFDKGIDKICKKVGEEAAEVIIAAKNNDKNEITCEISDVVYHMMVLMEETGVQLSDIFAELDRRR